MQEKSRFESLNPSIRLGNQICVVGRQNLRILFFSTCR
jgi:hypothetical protein